MHTSKTTACGKAIAKNLSLPTGTQKRKYRINFDEASGEISKEIISEE